MATLWITELPMVGMPQVAVLPPVAEQAVTFTTSTQSAALNAATRLVRLYASAPCYIAAGASPTATSANMKLNADAPEYFVVTGGQKLAALAA